MAMENLFNSPIMIKMQEAGQAIGRNKFLSSLQNGMMSLMAIIMVGAIFSIVCAVLGPNMVGALAADNPLYTLLYTPYNFTMNLLSVWLVLFMGHAYAKALKVKSPLMSTAEAMICFIMATGTIVATDSGNAINMSYLGAQGMFIGFFVVFVTVRVDSFCQEHNVGIKMPDSVPPSLANSFAAMLPLFFNCLIFIVIDGAISFATGDAYNLASGFLALLSAPLSALSSVPGVILLCTFAAILWCFGIHGTIIVYSLLTPLIIQGMTANNDLVAAGQQPVFYAVFLFTYIQACGGTGNTFALALLGLHSKSEQIRAVAKAGVVPGFFGINEPITFGMPIMYNPLLCIPYVLSCIIAMLLAWLAMSFGIIAIPYIYASATLPIGVLNYLKSLDIRNAIFDYFLIIPCGLIYYPFFKAYESQLVKQEQAALEA